MERTIYKLILLLSMKASLLYSQNAQHIIYHAFIKGEMNSWKNQIDLMQNTSSQNTDFLLELVNYQYGYIAWCLGNKKYTEAEKYLAVAEQNIKKIERNNLYVSEVYSYMAAFLGFRIALSMWKAPFLGPQSIEYASKALELNPNNPLAYIENGNIEYYMPAMFGGSKEKALTYYTNALKLMEQDSKYMSHNWNYLNLLTIIAQAYQSIQKPNEAKIIYEKILTIEPNYLWVKEELYPKIDAQ